MTNENSIARRAMQNSRWTLPFVACSLLLTVASSATPTAETEGKHYPSPEEAVKALIAAAKAHDSAALLAILGPEAEPLMSSGDEVADRAVTERFVKRYEEANRITREGDTKAVLEVGKAEWPFPIPVVKEDAGWRFDTEAGMEEIIDRRVGENELSAVQVLLAVADAQSEYYQRNPDGKSLLHYAKKFLSSEGKRDGLYWKTAENEEPSPLGPLVAEAQSEGYEHGKTTERRPYHGYYYRILTSQGPDAAGGAYDYLAKDELIGGFAAVAYPAEYGESGVMTFLVNHDGVVFQKDLGLETAAVAEKMTQFNPDSTWERVGEGVPDA